MAVFQAAAPTWHCRLLHPSAGGFWGGGEWEKVPITTAAPVATGFQIGGPHNMNDDSHLTQMKKTSISLTAEASNTVC